MFAAASGPALLQCAAMALCPESPAWLLRAGRPSDAVVALRSLHGARLRLSDYPKLEAAYVGPLEPPSAAAGGAAEQPLLAAEHGGAAEGGGQADASGSGGGAAGWAALWEPRYRRVMVLAAALPLTQQASGINTVIFYSSQVRERRLEAGLWVGGQGCQLAWGPGHGGHLAAPRFAARCLTRSLPAAWPRLCRPCPQVFEQAGLRSPILGSILMGLANLGGCAWMMGY